MINKLINFFKNINIMIIVQIGKALSILFPIFNLKKLKLNKMSNRTKEKIKYPKSYKCLI